MKIGKTTVPRTAICTSDEDTIVVRGQDLCRDLIGRVSFTEHFYLLLTGKRPTAAQLAVLDATLVAIAEHGLVPSVTAARTTLAAAPEAIQGAVAAGILGCGSVILGSAESAARFISGILGNVTIRETGAATLAALVEARAARRAVPGFGHPLHRKADPRVARLLEVAEGSAISGRHVAVARLIEEKLPEVTGKPLVMNVSGAIAAVMLDAGFPLLAVKGVPILARTASLIAHLLEEQQRPIGFILAHEGSAAIEYDGPSPAGFVATT